MPPIAKAIGLTLSGSTAATRHGTASSLNLLSKPKRLVGFGFIAVSIPIPLPTQVGRLTGGIYERDRPPYLHRNLSRE